MLNELELHLLNDFQRDFPLVPAPFAVLAERLGVSERQVIETLARLQRRGMVSRVGAVFRPHAVGASTLAAMAVPAERLEEVARLVNGYAEVNHNYEREHGYNLWFVVTAQDEARLCEVLEEIGRRAGYPVLHLPMLEDYHIDLGFDLTGKSSGKRATPRQPVREVAPPSPAEEAVIAALQPGLPLVARPFAELGARIGTSEAEVLARLGWLLESGVIRRMGVVVRHRELGYRANAMVVWDVPDDRVSELGHCLGQFEFVTLCYRRPRRLPGWRYNLFCMIHGRDRETVLGLVEQMRRHCGLQEIAHEVLFSRTRFKQRGARYFAATEAAA